MLPFLKWAGGKRWLVGEIERWAPSEFGCYYEPFLGGGAAFFHLAPARAVLSDANSELITAYRVIRDHPAELERLLAQHQELHSDSYYYQMRGQSHGSPLERAARFLYLNRTCWNGLYRVNLNGQFNVPRGTKNKVIIPDEDFSSIASRLCNAEILECDFQETIDRADKGDLVYVDPPYTVRHNANGFLKYNQTIFSWDDQIRLRDACFLAKERGATVIISNADHSSVRELYEGADVTKAVERFSVISGSTSGRQNSTELLAILRGSQ